MMENKQSQEAVLALAAHYRSLSDEACVVVDDMLAEQLGSEAETVRFDALALIADFEIRSTVPAALRRLADLLERKAWPGALYEWAKVNRVISTLTETRDEE